MHLKKDEVLKDHENECHPIISLGEVAKHDDYSDCWIVISDYVYDVTDFLLKHPGGEFIIMEEAGRDATLAFLGAGHDTFSKSLKRYLIGILPPSERLYS